MSCPHTFTSDEGTGYCQLAGVTAKKWNKMEDALHHCKCLLEAMLPEEAPHRQKHIKTCLSVIKETNRSNVQLTEDK